jgi:hypothetical protein
MGEPAGEDELHAVVICESGYTQNIRGGLALSDSENIPIASRLIQEHCTEIPPTIRRNGYLWLQRLATVSMAKQKIWRPEFYLQSTKQISSD